MDEVESLIRDIERFCHDGGVAESTFGRRAVNDGKLLSRLRSDRGVTTRTIARVRAFLHDNASPTPGEPAEPSRPAEEGADGDKVLARLARAAGFDDGGGQPFRFYDNRQKYLAFVNTCNEKWVIAERVGKELAHVRPRTPALALFDAGMGDGTVLTMLMRDMHRRFPTVPFFVVAKEISLEDVRLGLDKLPDRFAEHPATVLVVTNLYYGEAPWLMPRNVNAAAALNWQEIELEGDCSYDYGEQIKALGPVLDDGWRAVSSQKTGNPLYVRPSVLVIYRKDHKFLLEPVIPRPGRVPVGMYDLVVASHPYRARMADGFKARVVLAPLARSLAPGGRMLVVHAYGKDPGMEIIQSIWPEEGQFPTNRHGLITALKETLGRQARDLKFTTFSDVKSILRYAMHTLPSEIGESIGTSTLFAAWNAAIYVAQIEDDRLAEVMTGRRYLDATQAVLRKYGGLWFNDETFVVSRRRS
ncbi:MAG: hypothetical protein V3V17_01945 [Alphaproteobacteria bacterium]